MYNAGRVEALANSKTKQTRSSEPQQAKTNSGTSGQMSPTEKGLVEFCILFFFFSISAFVVFIETRESAVSLVLPQSHTQTHHKATHAHNDCADVVPGSPTMRIKKKQKKNRVSRKLKKKKRTTALVHSTGID